MANEQRPHPGKSPANPDRETRIVGARLQLAAVQLAAGIAALLTASAVLGVAVRLFRICAGW